MVGINTALKDNPKLLPNLKSSDMPKRIVLDSDLRIPVTSNLVRTIKKAPLIIAAKNTANKNKARALADRGAIILKTRNNGNKIDLEHLLKMLGSMDIMSILVEGGGEVAGSLFDKGLVDKIIFFISPKIIGGEKAISSVRGKGAFSLKDACNINNINFRKIGEDFLFEGDVRY
jgi:diaminohydroxyphosphoribosylaminopyrimidine deaminase/5-amino-6-(5-phosphoribosylamino)uracil reductase